MGIATIMPSAMLSVAGLSQNRPICVETTVSKATTERLRTASTLSIRHRLARREPAYWGTLKDELRRPVEGHRSGPPGIA